MQHAAGEMRMVQCEEHTGPSLCGMSAALSASRSDELGQVGLDRTEKQSCYMKPAVSDESISPSYLVYSVVGHACEL